MPSGDVPYKKMMTNMFSFRRPVVVPHFFSNKKLNLALCWADDDLIAPSWVVSGCGS